MSHAINDLIKKSCFEDVYDLYNISSSFHLLIEEARNFVAHRSTALLFECLWNFDANLLCRDKRTCVEAFIMYKKSMEKLHETN